jgi:hypothetical protein
VGDLAQQWAPTKVNALLRVMGNASFDRVGGARAGPASGGPQTFRNTARGACLSYFRPVAYRCRFAVLPYFMAATRSAYRYFRVTCHIVILIQPVPPGTFELHGGGSTRQQRRHPRPRGHASAQGRGPRSDRLTRRAAARASIVSVCILNADSKRRSARNSVRTSRPQSTSAVAVHG